MKPALMPEIILRRGLYWPGRVLNCFADQAQTLPSALTGWTPVMQVREQAGGAIVWTFATSLTGSAVTMAPRTAAQNLSLTVGRYKTELSFVNADGNPVGPYVECAVLVQDAVSVPTVP